MLYLGAVLLGIGALASLGALMAPLYGVSSAQSIGAARQPSTEPLPDADKTEQVMLASLEAVLSRPLRGDAVAPAPPIRPAPATQPHASSPTPVLVGTIGNSTAMLRTPEGNVVARSVGERVGDAELVAVRHSEIDLRVGGRVITLRKPGEPATP